MSTTTDWSSAALPVHSFPESTLFQSLTSPDSKTTTHIVAHRTSTWVPKDRQGVWSAYQGDLDSSAIVNALTKTTPDPMTPLDADDKIKSAISSVRGRTVFSIEEGAKVTDRVVVLGEDLCIYPGSTFTFPCKTLSIHVRRLIIVPHLDGTDNNAPITFDVSGRDATRTYEHAAGDGGGGRAAYTSDTHAGREDDWVVAADGQMGPETGNGEDGGESGNVYISGQIVSLVPVDNAQTKTQIRFELNGGNGGSGQVGGRGGKGGDGLDWTGMAWHPSKKYLDGGRGGAGRDGGIPGKGGNGGRLVVYQAPSDMTIDPAKYRIIDFVHSVKHGSHGGSVSGGEGGNGGKHGSCTVLVALGNSHYGSDGAKGAQGNSPTNGSVLTDGHVVISSKSSTAWIYAIDTTFLHMLVQRMMFEYQVLFSNYFEVYSEDKKSAQRLRFESSFEWIESMHALLMASPVTIGGDPSPNETDLDALFKIRYASDSQTELNKKALTIFDISFNKLKSLGGDTLPPTPAIDIYGKTFRYIPNIGFSLDRMKQVMLEVDTLESRRDEWSKEIATSNATAKEASTKIRGFQDYMSSINTNRKAAKDKVKSTQDEVVKHRKAVKDQIDNVNKLIANLQKGFWSANFSCTTVTAILESVASCLMFTPEAAGAALAGNLLSKGQGKAFGGNVMSIGSAASKLFTTVKMYGVEMDKDAFNGEFQMVEDKLGGRELKDDLGKKTVQPGDSDKVLKVVMIEQQRFLELCDKSYPPDSTLDQRNAFQKLVEMAQVLNTAIVEAKQALVEQAQVEAYFVQSRIAVDTLSADSTIKGPAVRSQIYNQLYNETYSNAKAQLVQYYHDAIRAIVAVKLSNTSLTRTLFALGSWENVSGQYFNDAILPQLRQENDLLRRLDNSQPLANVNGYTATLSKANYPKIFGWTMDSSGEYKKTGQFGPFHFNLETTNCGALFGIDLTTVYDVRLEDIWVMLKGAKLKTESSEDCSITLDVTFTGSFTVTSDVLATDKGKPLVDANGKKTYEHEKHTFEIDKVVIPSITQYKRGKPETAQWISEMRTPMARMLHLDDTDTGTVRPVQSPLAKWTIAWNTDLVDTSSVEEVYIKIKSTARGTLHPPGSEDRNNLHLIPYPNGFALLRPHPDPHLASEHFYHEPYYVQPLPIHTALYGLDKVLVAISLKLHGLDTYNRDSLTAQAATGILKWATGHRFTSHVNSDPKIHNAFASLGSTVSEQTKAIISNPNATAFVTGIQYIADRAWSHHNDVQVGDRYTTTVGSYVANNEHQTFVSTMTAVTPEIQAGLRADQSTIITLIKCLPLGATVLYGVHADAMRNAKTPADRAAYLYSKADQIRKDEAKAMTNNTDAAGSYVLLGSAGLVALDGLHVVTNAAGYTTVSGLALTTSIHNVEGMMIWGARWHQSQKEVMLFNWGQGGSGKKVIERANATFGEALFVGAHARFGYAMEARQTGKSLVSILAAKAPKLYESGRIWQFANASMIPLAAMRLAWGPVTAFDKIDTRVLTYKDDTEMATKLDGLTYETIVNSALKDPSGEPGIVFGETWNARYDPLVSVLPDYQGGPAGQDAVSAYNADVQRTIRTKIETGVANYFADDANRDAFKLSVATSAQAEMDKITKERQAAGLSKLSPLELRKEVLRSFDYRAKLRDIMASTVISDFSDQIESEMKGSLPASDLSSFLHDSYTQIGQNSLLEPEGLIQQYTITVAQATAKQQYTAADCAKMLTSYDQTIKDQSDILQKAQQERDALDPLKPEERAKLDDANRKVRDLEEDVEKSKKEREGYEAVSKEHKDPSGAKKDREDKEGASEKEVKRRGGL